MKRELVDLSDQVWDRIRSRVDGLSDAEYFWEPAPGCWSIRQRADGTWMADWPLPRPELEPFTTIAWRLWHVIDCAGRTALHLAAGAGELEVVKILLDHGADPTATDPDFRATPRQWADFLHHSLVVDYLNERVQDTGPGVAPRP